MPALLGLLLLGASRPATAQPVEPAREPVAAAPAPPADLEDLGAWLAYRRDSHRPSLPDEARLFYRRGLLADRSGDRQNAVRLVRGAAELDPSFVAPHLRLAAWALPGDPSQALLRYAVVLDLVRRSFLLQVELAANLTFFALNALFLGLVITALLLVVVHQAQLRHMWQERLVPRLAPASARVWAWVILCVPFVLGLGLALPALVLLGLLWPLLRGRERVIHVALTLALVAAPFAGHVFGRLAVPLQEENAPLYGVSRIPDGPATPAAQADLERLAAREPGNPFLAFGLGWTARQNQDLATAETAYRRALELWPGNAVVMSNLANVLSASGQLDPAVDLYRAALSADPQNAAAAFNLSQIYTRRFEYRAASEAIARASAIDFELVKNQQALGSDDGVLPFADQWIAPATFWSTILDPRAAIGARPTLPPVWRGRAETSGPLFSALALALAVGSILLGSRWQRSVPLRLCRNCGRVVCRRCSQRRREMALCPACAEQEARAESPEFARMLLARLRARSERGRHVARTVVAALLPGYGLLAFHRVYRAVVLITVSAMLTAPWLGVRAPFSYHSWPGLGDAGVPALVPTAAWFLVYLNSLLGYFAQASQASAQAAGLAEPVRSRPSSPGRITAKAA